MIHDPERLNRIRRETVKRGTGAKAPRNALEAAREQGDAALEAAGVERQGGTGFAGDSISFGIAIGQKVAAQAALVHAKLGIPFEIRERGPIKAL